MANWQTKLRLKDVYHEGKPIPEIATVIAERLRALKLPVVSDEAIEQQKEIIDEFLALASDQMADVNDFDDVMSRLFDWADTPLDSNWNGKKLCWVETF